MNKDKEFLRACDYAYKLLSYRQRSTNEIKERLEKKGFPLRTVKKAIKYLSEVNYLNDESFAKFWIRAKTQLNPCGSLLLRYQLKQKGIAAELLDKVLNEHAQQYDEYEAARKLAVARRRHLKNLTPQKHKRRLYDYLKRRGFSQDAILQAIEKVRTG